MKLKVLVGVGVVAVVMFAGWLIGMVSGLQIGVAAIVAVKLAWLVAILAAAKARQWWWALAIMCFGVVPALVYAFFHRPALAVDEQPFSLLRG